MRGLCLLGHLGLGDHILLNAVYRKYAAQEDLLCIPAYYHNCRSLEFMLRDLPNVVVRPVEDQQESEFFCRQVWKGQTLEIGCAKAKVLGFDMSIWDMELYRHAEVDFWERWKSWLCLRDGKNEQKPSAECSEFAFLHEDESRGFIIPEDQLALHKIVKPVIRPSHRDHIFQWWGVIEQAAEVHCICSSFSLWIDSIDLPKNPKLFLYDVRGESLPTYKKNWLIID